MRIVLLHSPSSRHVAELSAASLGSLGHDVSPVVPVDTVADAASAACHVVERNGDRDPRRDSGRPDMVLAAGWEAGVAAHLAARDLDVPVALRLARPGRRPGTDQDRMETALMRSSALVLVPSVGELDRLVGRGISRARLRVLPEAVDTTLFTDAAPPAEGSAGSPDERVEGRAHRVGVATPSDGSGRAGLLAGLGSMPSCDAVAVPGPDQWDASTPHLLRSLDLLVVADDTEAEVTTTLPAMACGVPVVAAEIGVLADAVADEVTGLLVGPGGMAPAIRSLLPDRMRLESFGLSAVDRVRARFAAGAVAATLEQHLRSLVPTIGEVAGAAS
ncbi:MAG TPA: glycosyltransferase [Actinomycetes bacterium]|nr:glycosyltransferase [Actinomycetes bacterium]